MSSLLPMLAAFLTFINERLPALPSRTTLLAVSGGIDSMVLADLFRQAGYPFAIAHCNFRLRGDESDQDEQFVRHWAGQHDIRFFTRQFDTQSFADRKGISIQMAARTLRYDWFDQLVRDHAFEYLATAHHTNDLLETTLLNLVRGTGPVGLPGMAPVQGYLIRPLLFASRDEILAHAQLHQIEWREDSSNQSDSYRRNLLRHQVVPVLQKLNPSLEATFRSTAERLQAANSLLYTYLTDWKEQVMRQEGRTIHIPIRAILDAQEPAFQLHFLLDSFGYSYAQSRQIVASLPDTSGKLFYSAGFQLLKDRSELILEPRSDEKSPEPVVMHENDRQVSLPGAGTLTSAQLANGPEFLPARERHRAYFDKDLVRFPLTVRPWQEGDWFCPFGMKGRRKKVSDLLIDEKVPLLRKKNCLVLLDRDQHILWVLGIRADDRFRVRTNSPHILMFELHN